MRYNYIKADQPSIVQKTAINKTIAAVPKPPVENYQNEESYHIKQ